MDKGFTIKCNKCGKKIKIKSVEDLYTLHTKEIAIMQHCEETYGFICCSNCGQEYKFDLEKTNNLENTIHTDFTGKVVGSTSDDNVGVPSKLFKFDIKETLLKLEGNGTYEKGEISKLLKDMEKNVNKAKKALKDIEKNFKFEKPKMAKTEQWSEPITKEEGLKYLNEGKPIILIGYREDPVRGCVEQTIIMPDSRYTGNITSFPKLVDCFGDERPIKEIRVWK